MKERAFHWSQQPYQSDSRGTDGKNFLFAIGIDQYVDLPILSNAVRDAQELVGLLQERYHYDLSTCITLWDEAATRKQIISVFDQLVEQVGEDDTLLIYFSGHGEYSRIRKRGFWIPVDAQKKDTSTYINNSIIRDYILDIHSRHTLLISDSCYAGSFFRQSRSSEEFPETPPSAYYQKIANYPSRWGLMSGGVEKVSDGQEGTNSPFNRSLINCLRYNMEPHLSILELISQLEKAVGNNVKQQPVGNRIYGVNDSGLGQFVFHLQPDFQLPVEEAPLPVEARVIIDEIVKGVTDTQTPSDELDMERLQQGLTVVNALFAYLTQQLPISAKQEAWFHPSLLKEYPSLASFDQELLQPARASLSLYSYPIVFSKVKPTGRTELSGSKGKEYLVSPAFKQQTGRMPGYIRLFYEEGVIKPSISGITL